MTTAETHIEPHPQRMFGIGAARQLAAYFSAALAFTVPCVWQQHIQANDLSSHLYNAWLANRAAAGDLKGIYVVSQYSNIFFDVLLSWLLKSFSVIVTERIAVILSVQIFFWGCFALASAVSGRAAWRIAPFLGLLAYGVVFRMGFFNFYISVGICCGAIALVWWKDSQTSPARWLAAPLLILAATAHFLPCLWASMVIAYILAARRINPSRRWLLLLAGLASTAGLAVFLASRVPSVWMHGLPIESYVGADQVLVYGAKYKIVAAALLCSWILLLVRRFELRPRPWEDVALQLWLLMAVACILLPDSIRLPLYAGGFTFIGIRLSLLSAIFLCALAAEVPTKIPEKAFHVALLVAFLAFSYTDERSLNYIEQKVATAIAGLPPDAIVLSTLKDSWLDGEALQHVLDRPCIGRCFDFADYEPATGQFRVRALPGNPYVISDSSDITNLEHGQLVLARTDIKVYRLFPCAAGREVCADRVSPGQRLTKQDIVPK
jgi:hypothetical protein